MLGTTARYLARSQTEVVERRVRGVRCEGGRRVILKRDRYASLSRCSLPSLPVCSLYDCLVLLSLLFLTLPLFPTPVPYILGRSFHPLDLPLLHPSATPALHSRRIGGRLCESVLEVSLYVYVYEIDVCVCISVCCAV